MRIRTSLGMLGISGGGLIGKNRDELGLPNLGSQNLGRSNDVHKVFDGEAHPVRIWGRMKSKKRAGARS